LWLPVKNAMLKKETIPRKGKHVSGKKPYNLLCYLLKRLDEMARQAVDSSWTATHYYYFASCLISIGKLWHHRRRQWHR
jgi:endo-1,4-beta-D-glucanase Y